MVYVESRIIHNVDEKQSEQIWESFEHAEDNHLFHITTDKPYNRPNLYRKIKQLGRTLDLEVVAYPHPFRHARATWMLDNRFNLKIISGFPGHSSTSVPANLYIHDSVNYDRLADLNEDALDSNGGSD